MNSQIFEFVFLIISLSTVTCSYNAVEKKFTECGLRESNIDTCIVHIFEDVRPLLVDGIPELDIPTMEPMDFQTLNFSQRDDAISLHARLKNVRAAGLSNYTIKSANLLADKKEIDIRMFIPVLRVSARYNLTGNIILLPVVGEGPMRSVLTGIDAHLIGKIVVKKEGGKEVLGVSSTSIDFQPQESKYRLSNLFNGDLILGETVNHFINSNDQLILEQMKPAVTRQLSQLVQVIMNSAISTLPLSSIQSPSGSV